MNYTTTAEAYSPEPPTYSKIMKRYDLESIYFGIVEHTNIKPFNFVEIGSRDGHDSATIAKAFGIPYEHCHVFEANPSAALGIYNQYPNMKLYNYAVTNSDARTLTFNVEPENIGMSSMLKKNEFTAGMREITVETIKMSTWVENMEIKEISTAKIDVEGCTLDVLKSFGPHITKLQSMQLEMEHKEIWKGQQLYDECAEWLKANGYVQLMFTLLRKVQSDSFWVREERLLV